jgi:hypothetical protein
VSSTDHRALRYVVISTPLSPRTPYLLTHSLTPYSTVLLEKLTGLKLVKKFPALCEHFATKIRFHGEELLAPRPNP